MKRILSFVLATITILSIALNFTSCSKTLLSEFSQRTIKNPKDILSASEEDAEAAKLVNKVKSELSDPSLNIYVGYSVSEKTVYIVRYTYYDRVYNLGIDMSGEISSVRGLMQALIKEIDFGEYDLVFIEVKGSESKETLDVLFVLKNEHEVVANYTNW